MPLAGFEFFYLEYALVVVASFALWAVMKFTASRAGLGMGRERIGLTASLVTAASSFLAIIILAGPAFLLGVLLFIVGWRSENRTQWIGGAVVAVASPLLNYSFIQNAAYGFGLISADSYRVTPLMADDVVLGLIGLGLVTLGAREFQKEPGVRRAGP